MKINIEEHWELETNEDMGKGWEIDRHSLPLYYDYYGIRLVYLFSPGIFGVNLMPESIEFSVKMRLISLTRISAIFKFIPGVIPRTTI